MKLNDMQAKVNSCLEYKTVGSFVSTSVSYGGKGRLGEGWGEKAFSCLILRFHTRSRPFVWLLARSWPSRKYGLFSIVVKSSISLVYCWELLADNLA